MEAFFHRFTELFDQLGLPSDPFSIAAFLREQAPLAPELNAVLDRLADE